jgi:hypothetical protein
VLTMMATVPQSANQVNTFSGMRGVMSRHPHRILAAYSSYYNETRAHLALGKDAPLRRAVQGSGTIFATPILFGLHHRYARI